MKAIPLPQIVAAINGRIIKGTAEKVIHKTTKRTENLSENSLFFALSGPPAAIDLPAGCTVVTDDPDWSSAFRGLTTVYVPNVQQAIESFMVLYRGLFDIPVIGITGSHGKTTTKEMITFILNSSYNIQATSFSNSTLSLNLDYLLGIDEQTQAAVFEMGAAYPGNLTSCCHCFQPTVCIITNITVDGPLGSRLLTHYLQDKREMIEDLPFDSTLIMNGDDKNIYRLDMARYDGRLIRFGLSCRCDMQAKNIRYTEDGIYYTLSYAGKAQNLFMPGSDRHTVYNALAAIAAVSSAKLGMDWQEAGEHLASFDRRSGLG